MNVSDGSALNAGARRDLTVARMNRGHELPEKGRPTDLQGAFDAYAGSVARLGMRLDGAEPGPDPCPPAPPS